MHDPELEKEKAHLIRGALLPGFKNEIKHAFRPETRLSDSQLSYLQEIIPCPVIPEPKFTCDHAIPKALMEFANREVTRNAGKTGEFIEIGPNFADFRKRYHPGAHACALLDNGRDEARIQHTYNCVQRKVHPMQQYSNAEINRDVPLFDEDLRITATTLRATERICVHGAERCTFQAAAAFAVHSLYDITPQQLHQIFYFHGLQTLTSWHFALPQIAVRDNFYDRKSGFWYEYNYPTKGKITMGFSNRNGEADASWTYTHDSKNYYELVFSQAIVGPEFNILKEVQQTFGYQVQVRYSRITRPVPFQMVRINTQMANFVCIPSLEQLLKQNYRFNVRTDGFLVDKHKFFQLVDYASSRSDDDTGYSKLHQYSRAVKSEVTIGSKVVQSRWDLSPDQLEDIVKFTFVYAMSRRFKRSKQVGHAVNELVSEMMNNENWFTRILQRLLDSSKFLDRIRSDHSYTVGRLLNIIIDFTQYVDVSFDVPAHNFSIGNKMEPYYNRVDYLQEKYVGPSWEFVVPSAPPEEKVESNFIQDKDYVFPNLPETTVYNVTQRVSDELRLQFEAASDFDTIQYSRTPEDPNYAEIYADIYSIFKDVASEDLLDFFLDPKFHLELLEGGPGTGKTTYAINNLLTDNTLIVVPTRKLKMEWEEKLNKKGFVKYRVLTFQMALTNIQDFDTVIVDEAFLLGAPYIAKLIFMKPKTKNMYLLGDPKQIGVIDFSSKMSEYEHEGAQLKNYKHFKRTVLNWNFRNPRDTVQLLNQTFGYQMVPKSNIEKSIVIIHEKLDEIIPAPESKVLVFAQDDKNFFDCAKLQPAPDIEEEGATHEQLKIIENHQIMDNARKQNSQPVNTVHEFQGSAAPIVTLVLTEKAVPIIENSKSHLIVGLSRHTEKLVIMSTEIAGKRIIDETCGKLLFTLETAAHIIPHDTEDHHRRPEVSSSYEMPKMPLDMNLDCYDPAGVMNIMQARLKLKDTPLVNVNLTQLPDNDQEITINVGELRQPEIEQQCVRHIGPKIAPDYRAIDKIGSLNTLITRYADKLENKPESEQHTLAGKLFETFTMNAIKSESGLPQWSLITNEDRMEAMAEFAIAIKEKNQTKIIEEFELSTKMFRTQFLQKDQTKAKVKENSIFEGKAGQGIGAWDKTLNVMFCVHFRAAEKAISRSLKDEYLLANGTDDQRLAHYMQTRYVPGDPFLENDYSEYDSSQTLYMVRFTRKIYEAVGVDTDILDVWLEQRYHRKFCLPGFLKMYVTEKKDSGEPATLIDNSLLNVGLLHQFLEIENLHMLLFKGDDSLVHAQSIKLRMTEAEIEKKFGIKTKIKTSIVPQFCAQFLTEEGLLPDIVSRTVKLLSRKFKPRTEKIEARVQDFYDYKRAVGEMLRPLRSFHSLELAVSLATEYYKDTFGFEYNEIMQMGYLLICFTSKNLSYDKFLKYTNTDTGFILNIDSNDPNINYRATFEKTYKGKTYKNPHKVRKRNKR
nr:MAG: nonstructural protein [Riboviria sp.]WKV33345.1 MAG: RNA-dependent RNA polymerase [Riboviria sp.]